MTETPDEAALLTAELLARRWLPRQHPRVRRALIDADLWQSVQGRLAQVGLQLVDNIHADHVSVVLVRGAQTTVFGEAGLGANNNVELPRDAVSLLVVLWALIILPKRERQDSRAASAAVEAQGEMFQTERAMPAAASVSPPVLYKSLLADFSAQLGKKMRLDTNLKRLEAQGFIVRRGDTITEGPLLDLLLDYDVLAPRILNGALGEVLARRRGQNGPGVQNSQSSQDNGGHNDKGSQDRQSSQDRQHDGGLGGDNGAHVGKAQDTDGDVLDLDGDDQADPANALKVTAHKDGQD